MTVETAFGEIAEVYLVVLYSVCQTLHDRSGTFEGVDALY